jgi:hypothetical protein
MHSAREPLMLRYTFWLLCLLPKSPGIPDHVISGTAGRSTSILNDKYSIQTAEVILKGGSGCGKRGNKIVPIRIGLRDVSHDFGWGRWHQLRGIEAG